MKKTILSGIQATGNLTLGNYIGAIDNFVKMQEEYNCYYMIANLHTLTVRTTPESLKKATLDVLAYYIACGLDPEKNNIFIQSQVHEHAELAWILNCYTYMGELSRMTQFKDKSTKNEDNINTGLFTYPVLMAADILLYDTDLVPIGQDQKQHLELARDLSERFNKIYGDTFKIPQPYVGKSGARIMGLQNPESKMSKSSENVNDVIYLKDSPEDIMKKIKKSVTDSEGIVRFSEEKSGVSNLITIYSCMTNKTIQEIEKEFENRGYGEFKQAVANSIIDKLKPVQEKYVELIKNQEYLEKIYKKGAEEASKIANNTLKSVYNKIGLI